MPEPVGGGGGGAGERAGSWVQTLLCLVCLALYWNSLQCGFVFDDISAIRDNR